MGLVDAGVGRSGPGLGGAAVGAGARLPVEQGEVPCAGHCSTSVRGGGEVGAGTLSTPIINIG